MEGGPVGEDSATQSIIGARWRFLGFNPGVTGRRLLTSTLWSVVSESLSRGLLLLSMVYVARSLGAASYGQFGLIRSTVNVFATLGGMGLGLTANRFVAEYRDRDKAYSGHVIGSSYVVAIGAGLFVATLVWLIAGQLANQLLHTPSLEGPLRIAALLLALGAITGAQMGILQGLEAYRLLALGSVVQGIVALVALGLGTHFYQLQGAVWGLFAYTLAGVMIFYVLIRNEVERQGIPITYTNLAETLPLFWKFSLPVMLAGITIAPLKWLAEISLVQRVGFAQLGIFHASLTIASMLVAGVSTLNAPLISLAANVSGSRDGERIQYVSLYGTWFIMVAIAIPLALLPGISSAVFGAKFATPQFQMVNLLLLAYCALMMYYQGVLRMVAINGSMWFGLSTNMVEGGGLLLGFYLFARMGATGLALAYVFSYLLRILVSLPSLLRGHIVPGRLLRDRYFLVSLLVLAAVIGVRLQSIR